MRQNLTRACQCSESVNDSFEQMYFWGLQMQACWPWLWQSIHLHCQQHKISNCVVGNNFDHDNLTMTISVQREPYFNFRDGIENICLSISCPRRDREFLSSSLMLRDEIEIFFLSISCFETSTRISFFQSRASRRAREFFHLISGFETRARNSVISSQFSRRERDFFLAFIFV